ncbi:MAG: glycosyltransferase family 4 protein [Planctomycetes bacterium]|nr:glycosyltransferase family 4 protein [Planctomycetota bacterium]
MRLAALVEAADHVCCRYRLRAFQPHLASRGHTLELNSLPQGIWNRLRIGSELVEADAVVLQRKLLSTIESGLLRRRVQRLIFDFDDAVWLRDSYSNKGFESRKRRERFQSIIRHCDAIVAGNAFLAMQAREWSEFTPLHIIPTCVDLDRYELAEHETIDRWTDLVWIGSSSTLKGLESIQPLLERIGNDVPRVRLKLICDRFMRLKNMPVTPIPWSESRETDELATSSIGISWIPDDPWSRGKCGLKVLQYMAAGLPVVANPVGVQIEMVRHGETGFLVNSDEEWVEAIDTLAGDPDLRRAMGLAGRRIVEEFYSVEAGANSWFTLLKNFACLRKSA